MKSVEIFPSNLVIKKLNTSIFEKAKYFYFLILISFSCQNDKNNNSDSYINTKYSACNCVNNRILFESPNYDTSVAERCRELLLKLTISQKEERVIEEHDCLEKNNLYILNKIKVNRKNKIKRIKKDVDIYVRKFIYRNLHNLSASNDPTITGLRENEIIITLINEDFFTGVYIFRVTENLLERKTYEVIVEDLNTEFFVAKIQEITNK